MAIPTVFHEESALKEDVKGGQNVYNKNAWTENTEETFKIGSSLSSGRYLVIGEMDISAKAVFNSGANCIKVVEEICLKAMEIIVQNKIGEYRYILSGPFLTSIIGKNL
ncbi:hypothetical protein WICPIJ_006176 [Wickerhamomyces pijperi]|uniref:Uncharacterized protein n=1 Tax=Wickerhamomyces pijperi TaxID=599730 RepID=A0A9P8Q2P6_WICPI|nr:hypothetical protein WICPIJ_006176 [Wickerhamomyces pijperi]